MCDMQDPINTVATLPLNHASAGATREPELADRMVYWRKQLAGNLPALQFCSARPGPLGHVTWDTLPVALSDDLSEALRVLGRREGVSLFVILLGAFDTLLYRCTGEEDILVGGLTGSHIGRANGDSGNGFLNAIPLRVDLSGDPSFRELLARVQNVALEGFSHELPLQYLLRELRAKNDSSETPLFQVIFSLLPHLPASSSAAWAGADLSFQVCDPCGQLGSVAGSDSKAAEHDLHLEMHDSSEGLAGDIAYNTQMFKPEVITRMLGHWQVLLRAIVADAGQRIGGLPILTDAERHQLLVGWNETTTDYPTNTPAHEMIEAQVERTPNSVAILHEDRQMSYRLLDARANQLGHYLRRLGAGPGELVGVCVQRSPDLVMALLGVLKSGAAYVPLDPEYPASRLSFMVKDSGLNVLVTQRALWAKFSDFGGKLVSLDLDREAICRESTENESAGVTGEDLAYVIYTSGSTGKPKGVEISHRSLANFLVSMQSRPGFIALDTLLAVTTVSFDIAALELYLPLMSGGRLVLVSRETATDGRRLQEVLMKTSPTVMQATPATWRLLLEAGWRGSPSLKILCGGEAMPRELARELLKRGSSVWNMYGPTETTVWSAVCQIASADEPITVGRPIANTQTYVLDRGLQPVPVGVPGELYIGGDGVARGYLHRPELTAEKFIPNPFSKPGSQARLYKTGDLARFRPNGEIECLGRSDHQVKVRGFRIELGEIESVLAQHPGVRQNVVWAREDSSGEKQLLAYIVASPGGSPSVKALRDFLRQKLPEYMVPSHFTFLEALPLTPNGKVDRRALPAPEHLDSAPRDKFLAPRDAVESQLVKMWEDVLGVRSVGISDNFFELGGHSLLAARLMNQIHRKLNLNVPIATLFQAPTIEQLAAILRQDGWSPAWSSLVPIQTSGAKPPFFCIHGIGGNVLGFYELARYLGPDQPFYGVQAQGLDGTKPPHTRVEEMAAHYVKEIRSVQPEGPYFLGGLSFGGAVALEMARQLQTEGQHVGLLALFDTFAGRRARRTTLMLKFVRLPLRRKVAYVPWKARAVKRRVERWALPPTLKAVRAAHRVANSRYVMRRYEGGVTLFTPGDLSLRGSDDPRAAWKEFASDVEIQEVPGDHDSMLDEPHVRILGERLVECLERAQATDSAGQLIRA
jgi:amino acid adenylation domain-containing protein